jgi:hypothetical protein
VQAYPFVRLTAEQLEPPPIREPKSVRKFGSHEEEMNHWRKDLRHSLACGLALFEEHVEYVRQHPKHAEWVKARVPPDAWARLDDPSQIVRFGPVEVDEEDNSPVEGPES